MADRLNSSRRGYDTNISPRTARLDSIWSAAQQQNASQISDFKRRRSSVKKLGAFSGLGGDVYAAIPRFYDPTEYWEFAQIPWDIQRDDHRMRLYKWLDLFYRTHYLIPILVDIFTRFPLVGMELHCKDLKITEFYEDIFFDRLDYHSFLVDVGREYWTFGQSFPLGSFNETLGVWEHEELLDPSLVQIQHVPILGDTQFSVKLPDLEKIAKSREPKELFFKLKSEFPELMPFLTQEKPVPMSDVLLKQVAFKVSPRDTHGTPILLRALRTLMHEEKLLASQDAIAERLYSPLILAKLGVQDLGDGQGPWIPDQGELGAFRDDLDVALASDFRLLVHHFGVEIQNVFGREQMPRLGDDFDRVERRVMQVFGVNPSLLSGGSNSQPYASSALQAEFLNQMLRTYQQYLKKHFEARAMIVAEAQEHYDYEKRGDTRVPIFEEIVEIDEDGNEHVVQKHKLLIPELRMKVLDLRDEATQRNFMQQLVAQGVALSDTTMAMGMDFDFDDELEKKEEEIVKKTVTQQEAKVKTYKILLAKGLPIPPDLKAEVEGAAGFAPPGPGQDVGGGLGVPDPGESIMMPPPPEGGPGGGMPMPPPPGAPPGVPGAPPGAMPITGPATGPAPDLSRQRTPLQPPGIGLPKSPGSPGRGMGIASNGGDNTIFGDGSKRKKKAGNLSGENEQSEVPEEDDDAKG